MLYLIFFPLFFLLFWLLLAGPRLKTQRRVKAYIDPQPKQEKVPFHQLAKSGMARVGKVPFVENLGEVLLSAGVEKSPGKFLLQSMLLGLVLPFFALPFVAGRYWLLLLLFVLGLFFPRLTLVWKITQRQTAFALQLGDALNLMSNSLKAGYSFLQAMELVAREMNPPISQEFSQVVREVSLGTTVEDALGNLASRVHNDDLELVLLSINIQRQVGGNLSEIFDKVASTIRERLRIKGEIKTLTAQGRLSSIIILLLPPVLAAFMFAINPQYMLLLVQHPLGQLMLMVGLFGQVLGILLIRRIIAIDV